MKDNVAERIRVLQTADDPETRFDAAIWLGEHVDARAIEPLETAASSDYGHFTVEGGYVDRDMTVSEGALDALREIYARVELSEHDEVRLYALLATPLATRSVDAVDSAFAIFAALGRKARPLAEHGLRDPDPLVRMRAHRVLLRLDDKPRTEVFFVDDEEVRYVATQQSAADFQLVRRAMVRFSEEPSARVRLGLAGLWLRCQKQFGAAFRADEIVPMLEDPDPAVRACVLEAASAPNPLRDIWPRDRIEALLEKARGAIVRASERVILLESHDQWNAYGEFDPVSGELRRSERDPRTVAPSSLRGKFSALAGKLLVLWNDGERLHVHVDEQRFALDDDVSVEYQVSEPAVFSIRRADEVLLRWEYASPSLREAKTDPTWSDTQYEDFDFGYYIADACANVQKRRFVHCLVSRPEVLGDPSFLFAELRALIAPPIATLREIRRWSWRWERPFVDFVGSFCSFCTCEDDRPGPEPGDPAARLHAVRLHEGSQVMMCQWCVACCHAALDGTGPSADPARVLDELSAALSATGVAHAAVLRAALERGCALATPAALPPGTACTGCGRDDQRVARAPAVSLCARCLPGLPAKSEEREQPKRE